MKLFCFIIATRKVCTKVIVLVLYSGPQNLDHAIGKILT